MSICIIESYKGLGQKIYVPMPIYHKLSLHPDQMINVKFGQRSIRLQVEKNAHSERIVVSEYAARRLLIRPDMRVHLKVSNDTLVLGPVVGIMTTGLGYRAGSGRKFSLATGRSKFFARFIKIAQQQHMLLFVFTPADVDWRKQCIRGFTINTARSGKVYWERHIYPFPDAIWNRVPHRGAERRADVQRAKKLFISTSSAKLTPSDYFYKWQMYELYRRDGRILDHIPYTVLLNDIRDVVKMLARFQVVFVKTCSGSHGHGIVRLSQEGPIVQYSYHNHKGKVRSGKVVNNTQLAQVIRYVTKGKMSIVQQGLDLARYNGHPFDIRATVQKGLTGTWQIVGLSTKIAGANSITTHVCNGGKVVPTAWLFEQIYPDSQKRVEDIKNFAINVAETTENASGWFLGELGMDIALDNNGKIWLFEVNSKPGRIVFAPEWASKERIKSYQMVVDYLQYLAGFGAS